MVPRGSAFIVCQSIAASIDAWAAHDSAKTAINEHEVVATYGDVAVATHAIHAALVAISGRANEPVIVFSKSDLVLGVSLHGILRAGKVYVPLDPSWPKRRIAAVVESTGSTVVIADGHSKSDVSDCVGASCRVLDFDQLRTGGARLPKEPTRDATAMATSLAWIIYTSGSSGVPKGITQPYRNVLHYAKGLCDSLALAADDRIGILSPLTAHGGLVYTLAASLVGASLYPIDPRRMAPADARAWIRREQISVLFLVPTVLRALTGDGPAREEFSSVRLLRVSGETVHQSDTHLYRAHFSDECALSVGFGATEVGGICEAFFRKNADFSSPRVPVGRPVSGLHVTLVDEHGAEVDDGRPGEFVVTGEHLSPGYWNSPELTGPTFVSGSQTHRRYRTGDVGLRRPDGTFEHLGRADSLVKVGGLRVELEEIEAALLRVPGVNGAAVIDARSASDRPRLVAFYSVGSGGAVEAPEIRFRLMQDLPLIMIPTRFVHLPTLPLTRTGKVDRSRLAAMAAEPMAVNGPQLPLATPLEQALTELCAEVLGVDRIDRRDNFFDVGGNSILAAAFFSQLQERLGYQLPLSALAVAPTMEQLAKYVECGSLTSERSCLVPIQPRGTRPPLFCVHGWGGNVVGFYPLAAQMGHRQPVFGIQSKGLFDMASADQTVEQMAATYIEEILARFPESPVCLAGLSAGGLVAYEMAQQLWARGRPVGRLVLFDAVARANGGWSAERVVEAADRLGERFHHHVTQVLLGPREQRLLYVRQRAHSMKRRLSSHMWQWGISARGGSGGTVADRWREVGEINYRAFRRYRLRPYPGNVTLFKAAERSPGSSRDPSYGWKEFAGGGVDVHVVPGNHTSMIAEPHVRELARTLERCIEDAV